MAQIHLCDGTAIFRSSTLVCFFRLDFCAFDLRPPSIPVVSSTCICWSSLSWPDAVLLIVRFLPDFNWLFFNGVNASASIFVATPVSILCVSLSFYWLIQLEYARFVKSSTKTRVNFNNSIAEKKNKYGGHKSVREQSVEMSTSLDCASQWQFVTAGLTNFF